MTQEEIAEKILTKFDNHGNSVADLYEFENCIKAMIEFKNLEINQFISNLLNEGYSFLCIEHGYNHCKCGDDDKTSDNIVKVYSENDLETYKNQWFKENLPKILEMVANNAKTEGREVDDCSNKKEVKHEGSKRIFKLLKYQNKMTNKIEKKHNESFFDILVLEVNSGAIKPHTFKELLFKEEIDLEKSFFIKENILIPKNQYINTKLLYHMLLQNEEICKTKIKKDDWLRKIIRKIKFKI